MNDLFQILREIGIQAYSDALSCSTELRHVRKLIQANHTGPDQYWRPPSSHHSHSTISPAVTSYFGRIDIVPFPFVVLFRHDQNPSQPIQLSSLKGLELLLEQNESMEIQEQKKVREALRALEGKRIRWDYSNVEIMNFGKGKEELEIRIEYSEGILRINRNSNVKWNGQYNYASGFEVFVDYDDGTGIDLYGRPINNKKLSISLESVGIIGNDFHLSRELSHFFTLNQSQIKLNLPRISHWLSSYQRYFNDLAIEKERVLSYDFLFNILAHEDLSLAQLKQVLHRTEKDSKVTALAQNWNASFVGLEARMNWVRKSWLNGWWFLYWDDIWRRNQDITQITSQSDLFSPHYSTSICYQPMHRSGLEQFLDEHGLPTVAVSNSWTKRVHFHAGILNRIYFYLDEMMLRSSKRLPVHHGNDLTMKGRNEFNRLDRDVHQERLKDIKEEPNDEEDEEDFISPRRLLFDEKRDSKMHRHERSTVETLLTIGTGGGTDHDDDQIRDRDAFPFEQSKFMSSLLSRGKWLTSSAFITSIRHTACEILSTWVLQRCFC